MFRTEYETLSNITKHIHQLVYHVRAKVRVNQCHGVNYAIVTAKSRVNQWSVSECNFEKMEKINKIVM